MNTKSNIARWDVDAILGSNGTRSLLERYAALHKPGLSAAEFLAHFKPQVRLGVSLGYALGKKLRLVSKAGQSQATAEPMPTALVSVLCALLAHGVTVETVGSENDSISVAGRVPSSLWHHGGQIEVELRPLDLGTLLVFNIRFPGQLFAWGAGGRLLRKLCETYKNAADQSPI